MSDDFDLESAVPVKGGFDIASSQPPSQHYTSKDPREMLEELQPTAAPSKTPSPGEPPEFSPLMTYPVAPLSTALGTVQNLGAGLVGNVYGAATRIGGASMPEAERAAQGLAGKLSHKPSTQPEKALTETVGNVLGSLPPNMGDIIPAPLAAAAKIQAANKMKDYFTKAPPILSPEEASVNEVTRKAVDSGFAIPPSLSVRPSAAGHLREGVASPSKVAQTFMKHNEVNAIKIAKDELGIPHDQVITESVLDNARKPATAAYDRLSNVPVNFDATREFNKTVNEIFSDIYKVRDELPELYSGENSAGLANLQSVLSRDSYSPGAVVAAIRKLREDAKGNLTGLKADNASKTLGRAQLAGASAMEGLIDQNLSSTTKRYEIFRTARKQGINVNPSTILKDFRNGRELYAKSYAVQDALGPNGTIYAEDLGKQLGSGTRLSGKLKVAADFARTHPSVNKSARPGAYIPGVTPFDIAATGSGLVAGAALGNAILPGGLGAAIGGIGGASAPLFRFKAGKGMLNPAYQSRMIVPTASAPPGSLAGGLSRLPGAVPSPHTAVLGGLSSRQKDPSQGIWPLPALGAGTSALLND